MAETSTCDFTQEAERNAPDVKLENYLFFLRKIPSDLLQKEDFVESINNSIDLNFYRSLLPHTVFAGRLFEVGNDKAALNHLKQALDNLESYATPSMTMGRIIGLLSKNGYSEEALKIIETILNNPKYDLETILVWRNNVEKACEGKLKLMPA